MAGGITALFLLIGTTSGADSAVNVVSLYDSSSMVPNFLLPFQIEGTLISTGYVKDYRLVVANGADCRMMPDPFLQNIFILKCSAPASVTMSFDIASQNTITTVNYGPLTVAAPGNLTSVGGNTGGDAVSTGKNLFNNVYGCAGCHSGSMPKGASVTDISSAISNQPAMAFLKGANLSSSDLSNLSAYLKSL